jgi:hypothetical protein
MRITGRIIIAATLLIPILATDACARPGVTGAPHPTASPNSWQDGMAPDNIAAVRESPDQATLIVDLNMPAGLTDRDCWRNLSGRVIDFSASSLIVQLTADFWSDRRCASTTVLTSVPVKLPGPLGSRTANINNSSSDYIADPPGAGTLRFCYEGRCTPLPPATCAGTSIQAAAKGAEVDPHATYTVRSCDAHWLVLDFAWTGRPACDNACASTSRTTMRWFYRPTEHGWRAITGTTEAGCAAIQRAEPAFPTELCANLGRP